MRKKKVFVSLAAVAVALFGGHAVAGAAGGGATHARGGAESGTEATGAGTGGGCGMAYDSETSTNIPPDDTTSDNAPAAVATLKKGCPGSTVAVFESEMSTPSSADFIHLDMRATCTATGGYSNPCTVGSTFYASPGHTFAQNGPTSFGTRSVQQVFTALKRGVWKFEVLPGGNNSANLQFRTFTVQSFQGPVA